MIKPYLQATLVSLSLVAAINDATAAADTAKYYRYINEKGELILTDKLPPEDSARGYDVINKNGQVKETIDRTLTEEERKAKEEEAKRKESDKRILGLYSSYEEIDRVRNSSISQIDANILIIQGNIKGLVEQRKDFQEEAAKLERIGKPVPAETTKQLFAIDSTIKNENKKLEEQQETKKQILAKFAADRARLGELLSLPSPTPVPDAELQPLAVPIVESSPTASADSATALTPENATSTTPAAGSSAATTESVSPTAAGNSP